MSEEEKNLVIKIERWINKEEEYCTNEDLKELLNILDKYVDLYNKEKLNSLSLSEQLNKEKEKVENIKWNNEHKYCNKDDVDFLLNLIQKQSKIIDKFSKALVNCVGTCPIDYNDDFENDCENCQDTLEKCWIDFFRKEVEKDGRKENKANEL